MSAPPGKLVWKQNEIKATRSGEGEGGVQISVAVVRGAGGEEASAPMVATRAQATALRDELVKVRSIIHEAAQN
jgi:hypothetical protein